MRGDLADVQLADRVFAPHYALAIRCSAIVASPILETNKASAAVRSEILPGEGFDMLELATDFAWGISLADGVVGFVARQALSYDDPAPDAVPGSGDPVAVAESMLGVAAKPGGRSPAGFNCSGLVYYALTSTGHPAPRFADLQAASVGVPASGATQRGDLIYFEDHAAIAVDADTVIHVTDAVVREPIADAVACYGEIVARRRL